MCMIEIIKKPKNAELERYGFVGNTYKVNDKEYTEDIVSGKLVRFIV